MCVSLRCMDSSCGVRTLQDVTRPRRSGTSCSGSFTSTLAVTSASLSSHPKGKGALRFSTEYVFSSASVLSASKLSKMLFTWALARGLKNCIQPPRSMRRDTVTTQEPRFDRDGVIVVCQKSTRAPMAPSGAEADCVVSRPVHITRYTPFASRHQYLSSSTVLAFVQRKGPPGARFTRTTSLCRSCSSRRSALEKLGSQEALERLKSMSMAKRAEGDPGMEAWHLNSTAPVQSRTIPLMSLRLFPAYTLGRSNKRKPFPRETNSHPSWHRAASELRREALTL
mmetsp:Transcript_7860/g.13874  ORF Transcript_7860/g.13874 Transcript_7860/m.13874 type:complete len:282 (+) Transcript_7860:2162-3007(+)